MENHEISPSRAVHPLSSCFEPQNIKQGMMNAEAMENLVKLHNSIFLVQYSIFNKKA
jgi:hypothetical protein